MHRIAVVGCGGSGKSTIARQLGDLLGLPVTHLDALYFDGAWNPMPHNEFAAIQKRLVAGKRWVVEGNYASTLPIRLAAADTVIFLDLPAVVCLWAIVRRRWRYRGGQHRRDGVFDRITWEFIRYVWGYRRSMRPRVTAMISEHGAHARLIVLCSRKSVNEFVAGLSGCRGNAPGDP